MLFLTLLVVGIFCVPVNAINEYEFLKTQTASTVDPCEDNIKYVSCYGAIGDGIADDTVAIQSAIDDGDGIVVLEAIHKISASLVNNNNNVITYFGEGKSEIIPTVNNFYKFKNAANASFKNIKTVAPFLSLEESTAGYDQLLIENCDISGINNGVAVPVLYNYGIRSLGNYTVNTIEVKNTAFKSTVTFFMSSSFTGNIKNVHFSNNVIEDFERYVIAPIGVDKIYFRDNVVNGNNLGSTSRVFFRTGSEVSYIQNNIFKNIVSNGEASVVYSSQGDIYYENNILENVSGNSNSHIISDKSSTVVEWVIRNNTFDQTAVVTQDLKAIIKCGNNRVDISDNLFIAPKMTSIQYGNTSYAATKGNTIANNRFIDVEHVIVIHLLGNIDDVIIRDNVLNTMRNPLGTVSSFDSRCRFLNMMNSSATNEMRNVIVSGNTMFDMDATGSLFWSNTYLGGGLYDIKLLHNVMTSGEALLRYRNIGTYPIHSLDILYNTLPTGMLIEETANPSSRIQYNVN